MNQSNKGEQQNSECIVCNQIKQIEAEQLWCQTCHLKQKERKNGKCIECKQINTGRNWCQPCNSKFII